MIDIADNSDEVITSDWVSVDTVYVLGQSVYIDTVSTIQNSVPSLFRVLARMDEGEYESNSEEVFSVDNILPTNPINLSIVEVFPENNGVHISWGIDVLATPDLSHYTITRVAFPDEDTNIENENIYDIPENIVDNFYIDSGLDEDMYRYRYFIRAYDINGNRSPLDMTNYIDLMVYDGSLSNDIFSTLIESLTLTRSPLSGLEYSFSCLITLVVSPIILSSFFKILLMVNKSSESSGINEIVFSSSVFVIMIFYKISKR